MKKTISINGESYSFFYEDQLNMWRVIESDLLINGHKIDLEIDLNNILENQINWTDIEKFIDLLKMNEVIVTDNINKSKAVLSSLFKEIYRNSFAEIQNDIDFGLSGIDYKGYCKNINLSNEFEYDLFFFPFYIHDKNKDIGSFVWRASFINNFLLGVKCER